MGWDGMGRGNEIDRLEMRRCQARDIYGIAGPLHDAGQLAVRVRN